MSSTIVGIDPGKSGGIAIYKKGITTAMKMPKNTSDLNEVLFRIKNENESVLIFLEKVSHFAGGADDAPGKKFAIAKMMDQYTELKTILKLNKINFLEVASVSWQSTLIERVKGESKDIRKKKYKAYAQEKHPEIKVTLSIADALCILSFALLKIKTDIDWVLPKIVGEQKTINLFTNI